LISHPEETEELSDGEQLLQGQRRAGHELGRSDARSRRWKVSQATHALLLNHFMFLLVGSFSSVKIWISLILRFSE
jgi:hypothetical protein